MSPRGPPRANSSPTTCRSTRHGQRPRIAGRPPIYPQAAVSPFPGYRLPWPRDTCGAPQTTWRAAHRSTCAGRRGPRNAIRSSLARSLPTPGPAPLSAAPLSPHTDPSRPAQSTTPSENQRRPALLLIAPTPNSKSEAKHRETSPRVARDFPQAWRPRTRPGLRAGPPPLRARREGGRAGARASLRKQASSPASARARGPLTLASFTMMADEGGGGARGGRAAPRRASSAGPAGSGPQSRVAKAPEHVQPPASYS